MLVQQRLLHPLKTSVKICEICGRLFSARSFCGHRCNLWEDCDVGAAETAAPPDVIASLSPLLLASLSLEQPAQW